MKKHFFAAASLLNRFYQWFNSGSTTTFGKSQKILFAALALGALLPIYAFAQQIQQISAGGHHTLALCTDGSVSAWGSNNNGQLGDGTNNYSATPVPVQTKRFISIQGIRGLPPRNFPIARL